MPTAPKAPRRQKKRAVADIQDVYRVATRIFRPDTRTMPLNGGIGSGEPTIVAIGKGVEGLGDVRAVLRKWDLGTRQ